MQAQLKHFFFWPEREDNQRPPTPGGKMQHFRIGAVTSVGDGDVPSSAL